MHPDEFRELLLDQPFRPFRLHLTGNSSHDILHPELAIVGESVVWLCTPEKELGPMAFPERWVGVVLVHIVEIEFIVSVSAR